MKTAHILKSFVPVFFDERERLYALQYAMRMSKAEEILYVLYFDYSTGLWSVSSDEEFQEYLYRCAFCTEDVRFIFPSGLITKL